MPTYRNDSTERSYAVQDVNDLKAVVAPGHAVQTYDRDVPSNFTLTSDSPALERVIHAGSGEDVWTGAITPKGKFNVSVSGEFTGTARLIRSVDSFVTELPVDAFTNSLEDFYEDPDPNMQYKLGVKKGELSSGPVLVILSK